MKKIIFCFCILLTAAIITAGCSNSEKADKSAANTKSSTVLKIGASPVPHSEILQVVKPLLAKDGIDLQIVEMSDYVQPNLALADKELDANFFQHIPYLEKFSKDRNLALTYTVAVHIEPMGLYSKKIKVISELPENATIGIPNDPTNGGRALLLLAANQIITLKEGVGVNATLADITSNPKHLQFKELEAPQLPRSLEDLTVAIINTNYALEAKLNPSKDALILESGKSPYVNILVVRKGDENRPEIQKLSQALQSDAVKKFIEEKYKGAILPAF